VSDAEGTDAVMVPIPARTFTMGNPRTDGYQADGEGPIHAVGVPGNAAANVGFRCVRDA